MRLKGIVVSGKGEAAKYTEKYSRYFKEKLGLSCAPGTLNIKLKDADIAAAMADFEKNRPEKSKKIRIIPKEKELFPVDCYKTKISRAGETSNSSTKISAVIVIPEKTKHPKNIMEIIAESSLRKELKLEDGDEIICELE